MQTTIETLTRKLPAQVTNYFKYCTETLKYGERPDYNELIVSFQECLKEQAGAERRFDWILQKETLIVELPAREAELKKIEEIKRAELGQIDKKKLD